MKKVRVILASVACVAATAGVFASKTATAVLGTFFVPSFANSTAITGVFCSISTLACVGTTTRCKVSHNYPGEGIVPNVIVSKTVRVNNVTICTRAFKD